MSEAIYDELIAPELLRIAKLCDEHGIGMVAKVEYAEGETGTTHTATQPKSVAQFIAKGAAMCNGNFDSLAIAVCREYDTSASIFLNQFNTKEE